MQFSKIASILIAASAVSLASPVPEYGVVDAKHDQRPGAPGHPKASCTTHAPQGSRPQPTGGAAPVDPSSGGAAPVDPSSGGAAPVNPSSGGAAPVNPSSGGAAPVNPSSGGAAPVDPSSGGAAPVNPSSGGAAPVDPSSGSSGSSTVPTSQNIESRQTQAIINILAGAAGSKLVTDAINAVEDALRGLSNWDDIRSSFTKTTVENMFKANPDPKKWHAAACYNKQYTIQNPQGATPAVKVELKSGLLKTDYDCMFIGANNVFHVGSDGGFQNLAFKTDSTCNYDAGAKAMTCK